MTVICVAGIKYNITLIISFALFCFKREISSPGGDVGQLRRTPDVDYSLFSAECSIPILLETEKYTYITFFFSGGVEKQFDNEEGHMIPSPKVVTYDKDPKMSVQG